MNYGFRVADFQNWLKQSGASIQGLISSMRFSGALFLTRSAQEHPPQAAAPQESSETFLDAEFLKKIERLRLVAKRLS